MNIKEDAKMENVLICNAASLYPEAPVSMDVLKNNREQIIEKFRSSAAEKKYLLIDAGQKELKEYFEAAGITVREADKKYGFVYGNAGAVRKVLFENEKPIPDEVTEELHAYSAEKFLGLDTKTVYVAGAVKKKGASVFSQKVKPSAIAAACGAEGTLKAMYFGYPMGIFISPAQMEEELELTTDYVAVYNEKDCILDCLMQLEKRCLGEECGRCVFGHEGTAQLSMITSDITLKKGKNTDMDLILDLTEQMKNQTMCEVGRISATTAQSAVKLFRDEIEEHITKKKCRAGVCSKFISYFIDPDLCTGCTDCEDSCDSEAILGKKKFIHVIDQDECIQCGECVDSCDEGAIVKAAPGAIRCPRKPVPCRR